MPGACSGKEMVNVNELAGEASPLILFGNPSGQDYRVNRCCGRRPTGAGGVAADWPPPNRRSRNDGPDDSVLSLAKLTPAGRLEPDGRV